MFVANCAYFSFNYEVITFQSDSTDIQLFAFALCFLVVGHLKIEPFH